MASQVLAGLAKIGHQIEAVAPITETALGSGDFFAGDNGTLNVRRFTMPYTRTSPDVPPPNDYQRMERRKVERHIRTAISRRRPDVVVIGRESFAPHVVDLARAHRVPSVLLVQGATTMGILNGTYPAPLAEDLLKHARQVDLAITNAHHMQLALAQLGLADVRVIPNPVDLRRFRPISPSPAVRERLAVGSGDLVVAHLSNLKALKRPLDLVEAADIAARHDRHLLFMVVGEGPYRAKLELACAERGLSGRFRFPGWIAHDLIPDVVNCADLVVMPSAGEAQALVYLEAQACERTLIASDIPAAREVVEDAQTGLLYPTGDVDQLAAKILMAAADPSFRARLGRQARQAVASHSLTRVVSLYAQLLGEIAEDRHPGGRHASPPG